MEGPTADVLAAMRNTSYAYNFRYWLGRRGPARPPPLPDTGRYLLYELTRQYLLLTTHYVLLATYYYYLLLTLLTLLATCYLLLATNYLLLTTYHLLFTTDYLLLATYYLLLTAHYLLLATYDSGTFRTSRGTEVITTSECRSRWRR